MIRKILLFMVGLPVAIAILLTFVGVVLALFGGMFGWEEARTLGGSLAKVGLLGIVALLFFLPMGDVLGAFDPADSKQKIEPGGAQAKADEQKERVE